MRLIDPPVGPLDALPALRKWRDTLASMPSNDAGVLTARRDVERWISLAEERAAERTR